MITSLIADTVKETLINCLGERIVALRGARNLDYPFDMSRFLRSVRLALHLAQTINQCFLKISGFAIGSSGTQKRLIQPLYKCKENYASASQAVKMYKLQGA